jgi:hypothetical protein
MRVPMTEQSESEPGHPWTRASHCRGMPRTPCDPGHVTCRARTHFLKQGHTRVQERIQQCIIHVAPLNTPLVTKQPSPLLQASTTYLHTDAVVQLCQDAAKGLAQARDGGGPG